MNPDKPHAVIVYIHGGGHYSGSSTLISYSPDYILSADVVLVTMNYRLGPLGFMTLKDKSLNVPGNAGLKDQQLAMKFVKDNIRNFGGDPNNVTLVGHSSGATCVGLHCIAESSRGLFNRAIVMSGSPVGIEGLYRDKNYALKLAKKLGFAGDNESDALAFLETANVLSMAEAQTTLNEDDKSYFGAMTFGPCIEPYDTENAFMRRAPIDLMKNAWSNNVDIMIGGTANEGKFLKGQFENGYEPLIPTDLKLALDDSKSKEFASRLENFYLSMIPTELDAFEQVNLNVNLVSNCSFKFDFSSAETNFVGYVCNDLFIRDRIPTIKGERFFIVLLLIRQLKITIATVCSAKVVRELHTLMN